MQIYYISAGTVINNWSVGFNGHASAGISISAGHLSISNLNAYTDAYCPYGGKTEASYGIDKPIYSISIAAYFAGGFNISIDCYEITVIEPVDGPGGGGGGGHAWN